MEEAPENGKELSHSAHANGMNEWIMTSEIIQAYFRILLMYSVKSHCHK
jgi:hypothetical protein